MNPDREFEVAIVGAGIAGLVTAVLLQRAGIRTLLIEERDTVGGLLASTPLGDLDVDAGAESFSTRNSAVADLVGELGIDLTVATPNPAGAMLMTGSPRRRVPLPRGTLLGIPGRPLDRDVRRSIGLLGSARAALDRTLPAAVGAKTTSLGALVQLRMGRRVRGRLVDSISRSVYSTPADDVDIDLVAPTLRAAIARTGSLAGAVRSLTAGARPGGAVEGIAGGMWQLGPRLAAVFSADGGTVWTASPVRSIARAAPTGFDVEVAASGRVRHVRAGRVVLATPGPSAARLASTVEPTVSGLLADAPFRGVTVAGVRLTAAALDDHPVGTGVIVADGAGTLAKALTHLNAKWAWFAGRLQPHEHILRLSFDGTSASTAAIAGNHDTVAAELSAITGVAVTGADISALAVSQWSDVVIPLAAGTRRTLEAATAVAEENGITFVGSWLSGTGLAAVVPHSRAAADRVIHSHQRQSPKVDQERTS